MAAKMCNVCGKRREYTGSKGTETAPHASELCNYCFEEGGWENSHSDNNHESLAEAVANGHDSELNAYEKQELEFMEGCWICHPEINLAQREVKKGNTGSREQGERRPQLNHKGHNHPQTPAARRACKAAFWARPTMNSYSTEQLVEAMATWNFNCDGNGKEIKAAKAPSFTVVPNGPKGGVINQLKKGSPKFMTKAEGKKLYGK